MRRSRRLATVVAVLLLAICFVVWTWASFVGFASALLPAAIALLALGYIPVAILGFRTQHSALQAVAIPTAVSVGLLNFCFMASLLCWLLDGVVRLVRLPIGDHAIGCGAFGLGFAAATYGLFNAARIRTTHYKVALRNLPPAWSGKRGVLVSDIHLGNVRSAAFSRKVAARIRALEPDVLFVGGDLFDGAMIDLDTCVAPWGTIKAPLGAFFVTGNHDEYNDGAKIMQALGKVGFRALDNERVMVGGLQIVGVCDGVAQEEKEFRGLLARLHIKRDAPSVLLSHRPSHLDVPDELGVSLQLSGHTHHGQFWPWSLVVGLVFGPYAYGLNRRGGLQVITSSGVGTWGPPMRVATRSEIVLIEFVGGQ